jgi:hypothetical protein
MVRTFRAALDITRPQVRLVGIACAGSLSAIAVHCVADFNLSIPGNAMLGAWIAGIASTLEHFPAQDPCSGSRLPRVL